eukprot:CAMPEP_0204584574 /NCGR_PEP_ID=MMETSP0661-20131031/46415_1 /ASSEMBLY_ACC=CAM_ASM_000606 /TAXON_ID=109239 /ORGANISM="Alexandrium margalefi, Strain AMGDE01CS-322" /LENGTH=53 /DNA_ID=CAMNT_0051594035 /DNA_START=10 /DNA_END=167 /DNA_ORIENTATION=-
MITRVGPEMVPSSSKVPTGLGRSASRPNGLQAPRRPPPAAQSEFTMGGRAGER